MKSIASFISPCLARSEVNSSAELSLIKSTPLLISLVMHCLASKSSSVRQRAISRSSSNSSTWFSSGSSGIISSNTCITFVCSPAFTKALTTRSRVARFGARLYRTLKCDKTRCRAPTLSLSALSRTISSRHCRSGRKNCSSMSRRQARQLSTLAPLRRRLRNSMWYALSLGASSADRSLSKTSEASSCRPLFRSISRCSSRSSAGAPFPSFSFPSICSADQL
mmetsp:Transcript_21208/g.86689  ORF Transcript_21208/g.86689 Transcript_21208/m.86689 type:complete len:223 (-) Transcript_21208:2365-3033(-)